MNKLKQRITIAEFCGWIFLAVQDSLTNGDSYPYSGPVGFRLDPNKAYPGEVAYTGWGSDGPVIELPDYLNNPSAIREARNKLNQPQQILFLFTLNELGVYGEWDILNCSDEIQAEAILRVIGKWEEEE